MRPSNSKIDRKNLIEKFKPSDFDNYEDFFYYLHLNNNVRYMHLVGMLGGLIFLPFAFYLMTWWAFVVYFGLFYGFGYISHYIFDGLVSRTAAEAPWKSFIYATKINLLCLRPNYVKKLDQEFYKKYPFIEDVYPRQ
jgi:hypothetical protein